MKRNNYLLYLTLILAVLFTVTGCQKNLDELPENRTFTGGTDYTLTNNMILPLIGVYTRFNSTQWENFPLISVRGDDVNSGGQDDQQDYTETDKFKYNKDYWMYNSVWQNYYQNIFVANSAIEQINLYKEFASNKALADQYIAEIKVLRGWWMLHLTRLWGPVLITENSSPSELLVTNLTPKDDVMKYISAQMDEAIPLLPAVRPNERADLPGSVTKYTAYAVKAIADLELKDYPSVASSTSEIINSNKFQLESDYYELFKIKGKLNNENLLEMQYSDLGTGEGDNYGYLYGFFGPQGWTPAVTGAGDGWGFFEPSLKYIKFMLSRGETVRLETSVIFTNRGIAEIKTDPAYTNLPAWVSNKTKSGDVFNDFAREMFVSGKHYLPSNQLTPGRTEYGTNKNFTCIRYAEILLMHAEALTLGATSNSISAVEAVNAIRLRAGLPSISSVTNDQVMDEKYAELAMEWGTRFYDMVRLGKTSELTYDGRTYSTDKQFLPYPQNQVDLLPALKQ